ncbi:cell wall hydrolase [Sporolactobacillus sp. THM7-4]|nr:cell wall hydrolase [Sporolactobacillus sp. THM7-4]
MKKLFTLLCSSLALIGFSYVLLFIISSIYSPKADHVPLLNDDRVISPEIEHYRPLFQKYARDYNMEQYTDLLMAMAMQESKGKTPDIMQASESIGLPKDTINNPKTSIRAGTRYFKKAIEKSEGDVHLAVQSYNFGTGFIDYVNRHGGHFNHTLARAFSRRKARELGWDSYGDPKYVDHVMRYYDNEKQKRALAKIKN